MGRRPTLILTYFTGWGDDWRPVICWSRKRSFWDFFSLLPLINSNFEIRSCTVQYIFRICTVLVIKEEEIHELDDVQIDKTDGCSCRSLL